jgi:hypothetical protein
VGCDLIAAGMPVAVQAGSVTGGIDFPLATGGSIAGTVRDAVTQQPLAGVLIELFDGLSYNFYASTDESGAYIVEGLATGSYYLRTRNENGYVDELYGGAPCVGCTGRGSPVSVTAGQATSAVDFALAAGGHIAGTVTRAATSDPLYGAVVGFFAADGAELATATTDWEGHYALNRALPAGTYYAAVVQADPGLLGQIYEAQNCSADCRTRAIAGTAIAVAAGSTTSGIDFPLVEGGTVAGRIVDAASGEPVPAIVRVVDAGGRTMAEADTDFIGRYKVQGLLPGNYYVVTDNEVGYVNEIYGGGACLLEACAIASGTPVGFTSGYTMSGIDFELDRGGRIAGTMTRAASGDPAWYTGVRFFDTAGRMVAWGESDAFGRYVSEQGLPAGTYYARTVPSPRYALQQYDGQPCPNDDCEPTDGSPISVAGTSVHNGVDFALNTCSAVIAPNGPQSFTAPLGAPYQQALSATGGTAPYSFVMGPESGELPPGLSIDRAGVVYGTPTKRGSYPFSVWAIDASGCAGAMTIRLVADGVAAPTITPSATTALAGQTVTATIANGPGNALDWVGLYPVGGTAAQRVSYQFLNGMTSPPATGVTGATLTFVMPAVSGTYELRFFRNNTLTLLATSPAITVTAPSVTVNPTTVRTGGTVTATIANGPGYAWDWVGLYPAGGTPAQRVSYQFLNGLTSPPATGVTGATLTFTMPGVAGTYELRFYRNNSLTLLATSAPITVTAPSIAVSPTTVKTGASVTATVANGPGYAMDWVGLYPVGGTAAQRVSYQFLNGLTSPPASGTTGATLTFTMPAAAGTYELRLFRNNSLTLLATSAPITVTAPSITVSPTTVTTGGSVTATVANGPGYALDWVGLYPVGGTPAQRISYQFLNGLTSPPASGTTGATLTFTMPTVPGTFELRLFRNNTLTLMATSLPITVTAPSITPSATSVATGSNVTVTIANGPGNAMDWVGLYPVGGTAAQRISYQFLNGLTSPPATGATDAILTFTMPSTPGSYELRFFRNNSWTLLASTAPITVTGQTP